MNEVLQNAVFLSKIFGNSQDIFTTDQHFLYTPISKLDPNDPNYFAICTVTEHRRKNDNFTGLHLLVCDDIGTKAPTPPLAPSYVIETSPNNYQWGYRLTTPIEDINTAKTLISLLIRSGYTDPGAHGVVRLVRLPSGTNLKNGFKPRLISPAEDLNNTFSTQQLMQMLSPNQQLSLPTPSTSTYEPYTPPEAILSGSRNTQMTQLFGHYIATSDKLEEAIIRLYAYNQEHCVPPLDESELQTIIKSISQKERERVAKYIDNIYHVVSSDTWYDFKDCVNVTASSINTRYLKEFPGGKNQIPNITKWLPKQDGYNEVADLTWSPLPYGSAMRTMRYSNKLLLNTWEGFPISPKHGDVQPWLDHLVHLIPEEDYRRALLWWIAFTIQMPHIKTAWQPIILGISGAGKDALFRPVATILGKAFKSVGNKDIKGDYDDGLYQTKLLHISEAHGLRGAAIEFYKRITATESSTMHMLNIKCAGKVYQQNICNVLVITNNLDAMKFDREERRAFVVKAPEVMTDEQQVAYFDNWLEHDGPEYLFDYLLNYDLSEFKPGKLPYKTTYFNDMFDITRSDEEVKLEEFLADYDIARPELLADMFGGDDRYSIKNITIWLEMNGWARWDGHNSTKKIQKTVNGEKKVKARNWYVKKCSKFDRSKAINMYDEVERVEKIFQSLNKSKY